MANKLYEENSVQNIANAIREQNGETTTYTIDEMAQAILDLSTGLGNTYTINSISLSSEQSFQIEEDKKNGQYIIISIQDESHRQSLYVFDANLIV